MYRLIVICPVLVDVSLKNVSNSDSVIKLKESKINVTSVNLLFFAAKTEFSKYHGLRNYKLTSHLKKPDK